MKKILAGFFLFSCLVVKAQQEFSLYGDDPIPNSKLVADQEKIDSATNPIRYSLTKRGNPTLTVYHPLTARSNGTAVIICPGGGYMRLSMTGEGMDVAKWLSSLGITAFVLKYRLPSDETMINKAIGPLQDAQRAIQVVRQQANEWGVDTGRIGLLGFSAGGHLASTAGTHFLQTTIPNKEHVSLRPDFLILIYPVISFYDSLCHLGSRDHLLGTHPDSLAILAFSNERHVTEQTPPAFIVHAENDEGVPVMNSLYFYDALVRNHVPAELTIYPKGGHAFGMHNPTTGNDEWTDRLKSWLKANGWL